MAEADFAWRYGPTALILGGSEGVGAAFAHQLAAQGLDLLLVARKPEPLEETAAAVRAATGRRVRTLSADLTAPDAVDRIASFAGADEVGLVVYNAGAESRFLDFLDRPAEESLRMAALNVTTPIGIVHRFAGPMAARGRGGFILVSSVAGVAGCPRNAVYSATKAFSNGFAEALWYELKPRGIDMLGLVLGLTLTPAMQRMGLKMDGAADPALVAAEGIAHIADGPTFYAAGTGEGALYLRSLDRGEAVRAMASSASELG
ncbi:SDR family NAD(P)-dependent oxidoreductase [Flavisphingomonas formosensis]|uniref:SDR family NAD(P)-dependent oxidoreductase n=1 Tax=Flavisphingomonas formosensis TaxID=861534 RepID=UPI0012FCC584|nr:SDR family NAD(P)-dependent oxidoreductase [Sphingomonas formosensis]